MEKDEIFLTAERYVKYTGKSIFLTGRAGTGKTTFLRYVAQTLTKRFVILAPTGVAAVTAGGTTIHSFFHLPLCPYLPDVKELITEYQLPERYHSLSKERIRIIRALDLLIIDEISMVRADLLDAVDMCLRRYRRNDRPFGGVQLLMIGDIHQLSPVVKDSEARYISQVYPSPFFFYSKALRRLDYITIELEKVHRQRDAQFIEILNAVRENRVTSSVLRALNARVGVSQNGGDVIRLTTHNAQADRINQAELEALPGDPVFFDASITGDFPESSFPADEALCLKRGAKVMFIRNDVEGRFYNGKMGMVTDISEEGVVTVEDADGQSIEVESVNWDNIQYSVDEDTSEITPKVVGSFRQLPLRVAWAVTIHKSQGLTFDNVIIDATSAFAYGQVYVALSRCRTLEGISLESPIYDSALYQDRHITSFDKGRAPFATVQSALDDELIHHRFDILRELFDLQPAVKGLAAFLKSCSGSIDSLYEAEFKGLEQMVAEFDKHKSVGDAFCRQLSGIETARMLDDTFLNERLLKAAEYFLPIMEQAYDYCGRVADLEVDNKAQRKKIKETGDDIIRQFNVLCCSLRAILNGEFSVEQYGDIKSQCFLDARATRSKSIKSRKRVDNDDVITSMIENAVSMDADIENLRAQLQEWRTERYKADNVPAYTILHQSTLLEIATLVPKTREELLNIKGFGRAKLEKYGDEILAITSKFI